MQPRFIAIFFILCCCIVFATTDEREETLVKCRARCNRLFVKHRTDQKGKQTCYNRCTDPRARKQEQKQQQQPRRCDNVATAGSQSGSCGCLPRAALRKEAAAAVALEDVGPPIATRPNREGNECGRKQSTSGGGGGCCNRCADNKDDNNNAQASAAAGTSKKPIAGRRSRAGNSKEGSLRIFKTTDEEFRLREIYGDGNCMFRAISFVLWGTETRHRQLRSLVVKHIEDAWRELRPYVLAEWNVSSPSVYANFMRADGTFASELECVVATRLKRLNLAIYRRADAAGNLRCILQNRQFSNRRVKTANLLFSGRNDFGHYDVLMPQR